MNTRTIIARAYNSRFAVFWDSHLLPTGLPLLLGGGLALLLAKLIVGENLFFALPIVLLVPMAILVIRYPFAAIIIWMVVMPWFPFSGIYKYLYFTVHRLLIPLALAVNILSRMLRLKKHKPVQLGPASLAMVAFGAMAIVSIFVTGNHWKTLFTLQDRFLVPFTAYWLIRFSDAQERDLKRLIPFMLLLNLAEYAIGLMSWFVPGMLPSIWHNELVGNRTMGTFGQPAAYACVLILFSILFYHDAVNRPNGPRRMLQILALGLGMVCLFFTFTRGIWLAGILVLLGLLYLYPKPTVRLISLVVPIMLILLAGPLAREFAHAVDRLESTEEGGKHRLVLANAGKEMFYARPVFGWGFSNYDRYDWKFLERVGETSPTTYQVRQATSHHTYLTILAEMGSVGFFLYAFPVIWWLIFTIKALPRLPKEGFWNRRLLVVMWFPIVIHIVLAQDIDMRFFPYCLTLFWINLGFIANLVQSCLEPNRVPATGSGQPLSPPRPAR